MNSKIFIFSLLALFSINTNAAEQLSEDELQVIKLADLGRALFFDVNLSLNRTQSCATCHDPAEAFTDWRDNGVGQMASLGDDGASLGDRNAPTVTYAALTPIFSRNAEGDYVGGLFWDGREPDLAGQAGGPPINPIEMAMPDKASVVERLMENPVYQHEFPNLFGDDVFMDVDSAYSAMTQSIAAYESTEFLSPFNSRYDRYLRGELKPNQQEELGMTLFFSEQFSNCNQCHQLKTLPESEQETFTNYQYHNIGTPVNTKLRQVNGKGYDYLDYGLLENPSVDDPEQSGRFKVPSLRNVSVTGPYMHNGVFEDLRTVVLFYNKYNSRSADSQINPETGLEWGAPEIQENLALDELESASALDDRDVDAIVAFLNMLTDQRYEHLLQLQRKPPH